MPRPPMQRPHKPAREARVEEVRLHGWTHGAEAVGRLSDGKAVFVPFAIPGEHVRVKVVDERARWARAELVEVLEASPDRIRAACPLFGRCGGCATQHIEPDRRRALQRQVVIDQLERIAGLVDPPVGEIRAAGDWGYRSTARFAVAGDGRLGFRAGRSHTVVPVEACPLLHPHTQAVRDEAGDGWATSAEVMVRATANGDGGTLIVLPEHSGGTVTETVSGFEFRVSPGSFFQQNIEGAAILLELVRAAADVVLGDRALDLYAGVGLFARGLAEDGAEVIAVETNASAVADARENLSGLPAEIWQGTAEEALDEVDPPLDIVVLDPPRAGAGAEVMRRIAGLRPRVVIMVSCDPAALARDTRTLIDAGYALEQVTPVDQFAQTASIEAVAVFHPAKR
jgi:23S rRNA (uracil1939-C5)-methyltransferase